MDNPATIPESLKSDAKSDPSPQSSVTGFGSPPFNLDIGQNTTIQATHSGVDRNQPCPLQHFPSSRDLLNKHEDVLYERSKKRAQEVDEKWFQRWNEQNKVIQENTGHIARLTVGIHFQFSF